MNKLAEFYTVITDAGREAVARATQAGEKVDITHFAVGDGGGSAVTPDESQTQLVNECWRGLVATYKQDGTNIIIDTYIPSDEESFTAREMGIFTADGVLFAVSNIPDMRKVLPSEGAVGDFAFGMKIDVSNLDTSYIEIHTNPMLPFILESEKGRPDGVAPHNKDKVLEIEYGGTWAKTAQEAIYNLGCMPRENLLDNAHFIGGGTDGNFPINPKGLKQYNTVGSCIPRWKLQNANSSLEIVDDGIILRNNATEHDGASISFFQIVSKNVNQETVTYAIIVSELSGDWYMAYNNARDGNKKIEVGLTFITIPSERVVLDGKSFYLFKTSKNANDYIKFQDLKLEKGDTQTLAWEDKQGQLHLYEKSDYITELLKCQYYLQMLSAYSKWSCLGYADCNGTTNFIANMILAAPLRIMPSIKFSGLSVNGIKVTDLQADQINYTMIKLRGTLESSVPTGVYPIYQDGSDDSFLELSAEL